jgi:hypothetical protein
MYRKKLAFVSLALIGFLALGGCSMNRCKTVVDPNAKAEGTDKKDSDSEKDPKDGPWATPPHNPSATLIPGQVSKSTPKPSTPAAEERAYGQKPLVNIPPPSQPAPGDSESALEKTKKTIKIYKYDGSRQCGQGTLMGLEAMAKELKGIAIFSQENKNDGMMRIQMCGAPTGNANIYEINVSDMKKAFKKGFREWKPEPN